MRFTFANEPEGFDVHINNSIRGYSELWTDVVKMSDYFVSEESLIIDIGCSTGKMLVAMAERAHDKNLDPVHCLGFEVEEDFRQPLADNFLNSTINTSDAVTLGVKMEDIANFDFSKLPYGISYATSIFTLQFIQKEKRQKIIREIYNNMKVGGAFVFAEKVYSPNAQLQDVMTFMHYDHKSKNFSAEEILNKERTLRNMLRPNTREELEDMIGKAGFTSVQPFWQNYNFVGYICIKT